MFGAKDLENRAGYPQPGEEDEVQPCPAFFEAMLEDDAEGEDNGGYVDCEFGNGDVFPF